MNWLNSPSKINLELASGNEKSFEEHKVNTDSSKLVVSLKTMKSLVLYSGLLYVFMVFKQLKVNFVGSMSRIIGKFSRLKVPKFILTPLLKLYSGLYGVNLEEAEIRRLRDFRSFNEFFTRKLKKGIRVIERKDDVSSVCSP